MIIELILFGWSISEYLVDCVCVCERKKDENRSRREKNNNIYEKVSTHTKTFVQLYDVS